MDVVPEGVSDVLSYFFPSKLQHLLLTDVISLFPRPPLTLISLLLRM